MSSDPTRCERACQQFCKPRDPLRGASPISYTLCTEIPRWSISLGAAGQQRQAARRRAWPFALLNLSPARGSEWPDFDKIFRQLDGLAHLKPALYDAEAIASGISTQGSQCVWADAEDGCQRTAVAVRPPRFWHGRYILRDFFGVPFCFCMNLAGRTCDQHYGHHQMLRFRGARSELCFFSTG